MSIGNKTLNLSSIESKWYTYWLEKKFFESKPSNDKQPFTIVIPPPNVTGVLHMGHMLNNTIQDVLIRKARLEGKNACWVPGTDHASIATETKVVQMLREQGIKKYELSREEFLKYAWEWKYKYGGIILKQLEKLGASCDWERTRFTMEPKLSEAVINCFVDLYEKKLIYRELRMVNWDPEGKTALSDEEVIYKEIEGKLYYIKYFLSDSANDGLVIATTRPETILADVAICVNPNDERYKKYIGCKVLVPFIKREIPIIADEYVDKDFGTGCLKITPAHDKNDYEISKKHDLQIIDILSEVGQLNENCLINDYIGKDRFTVRKRIVEDLESIGQLEKIEPYKTQIGTSERTGAIIEPRLTLQWWVDMNKFLQRNPEVLSSVLSDEIKFHPNSMKNTYKYWIENIKDWCISRQLWWGQQIPAWYDNSGNYVVAKNIDGAIEKFKSKGFNVSSSEIRQDEDVLDTWFSSWLWPISVFDGFENPDNPDIKYYYPTNDLVTAPEIMFFWVARMIMAGYEWRNEKPFTNVYFTGIVRDKQRRKMSKSLGNSPDPIDLINKYGADGVRMGMLLCSPAGNDILFDESLVEQGRNFTNKIWNAYRLIKSWQILPDEQIESDMLRSNIVASNWMNSKLDDAITQTNQLYTDYKLSEVLMKIYKLIWDDFCSWYLEIIKPSYGKAIDDTCYNSTIAIFDKLLRLLHPFMPFITEELWQSIDLRKNGDSICISSYPKQGNYKKENLDFALSLIMKIREFRNTKGLSFKDKFDIQIISNDYSNYEPHQYLIKKLSNVENIIMDINVANTWPRISSGIDEVVIFVELEIDKELERKKLSDELNYLEGFLESVLIKLSNEKFIANANPELITREYKKRDDTIQKIEIIKKSIAKL